MNPLNKRSLANEVFDSPLTKGNPMCKLLEASPPKSVVEVEEKRR